MDGDGCEYLARMEFQNKGYSESRNWGKNISTSRERHTYLESVFDEESVQNGADFFFICNLKIYHYTSHSWFRDTYWVINN